MASFSSAIGSVAFTMFWNIVLFLCKNRQSVRPTEPTTTHKRRFHKTAKRRTRVDLLEVKCQICGDDADIKQVLHMLKLSLLEVAEDVQGL